MFSDCSLSAKTEEIGLDTSEKESFDDYLVASELVEIAGTSKMEVENAKLKADLASAISRICSLTPQVKYESEAENMLKIAAEKTTAALQAKMSMRNISYLRSRENKDIVIELEQHLTSEYLLGQRNINNMDASGLNLLHEKVREYKSEAPGDVEGNKAHVSGSEHMDEEGSCVSNLSSQQPCKAREPMDEIWWIPLWCSVIRLIHQCWKARKTMRKVERLTQRGEMGVFLSTSSTAESSPKSLINNVATGRGLEAKHSDEIILELRNELMENSSKLSETEF